MKTMFKGYYTTKGYDWTSPDDCHDLTAYVETIEEAMKAGEKVYHEQGYGMTGNWWVEKEVMDEATFTHTTEVVYRYNWWNAIGKYEDAERALKRHEEELKKAEAIKARTETGEKRKATKIAEIKRWIEEDKATLAERNG